MLCQVGPFYCCILYAYISIVGLYFRPKHAMKFNDSALSAILLISLKDGA